MGTVYEALDQRINCIVALKETSAGNDDEARRVFEREASLLGNLRHSALPKVMDYFSEGDGDFLVMEFIPGHDLAELLELRGGPFPQTQVLGWADEMLDVLEYLHGQRPPVLHRDIKPSNLKVTKQGEIFLLDFGLAKGTAGQMATFLSGRSVHGYTAMYASLEQIHGHGTDPRSDLYSLGATLFHLLTATSPVDAPTRFTRIEDEQPDPLQPITKINGHVSTNVAAVIHQAMAINRRQRPASATEMRKALRQAAEEDERSAEEEEYRRAELEQEKRRTAEETERRAKEERRRQDAETRAREKEARRREAEETRVQAEEVTRQKAAAEVLRTEETRRAETEERHTAEETHQVNQERRHEVLPETILSPPPPIVRAQEPGSTNEAKAQPGIKTIPAPPPAKFISDRIAEEEAHKLDEQEAARRFVVNQNRQALIAGVVLAVLLGALILMWSMSRTTATQDATRQTQPAPSQQTGQSHTRTNQAGIEFVLIPPGSFMMGSTNEADEGPVHRVTISKGFYMGKYEVTQAQWQSVMGNNPSEFKNCGGNCPVEEVSWDDAQNFINKLNASNDGFSYRLPTEAEWEYACRAGTTGDYAGNLNEMAWHSEENSRYQTHAVGGRRLNDWGLADMHGNVWEWCQDWYHETYYGAPTDGSAWLSGGEQKYRVLRGGASWYLDASHLRSAYRYNTTPDRRANTFGIRLVAVVRTQ